MDRVSIVGFERAYLDGLQEVAGRAAAGRIRSPSYSSSAARSEISTAFHAAIKFLREVRAILLAGDMLLAFDRPRESQWIN